MSKPYTDNTKGKVKIRTFESNIESDELVWHRDRADRVITILEGDGWMFQMDNEVPQLLEAGDILNVSKMAYHRIYKAGTTPLKIKIDESMKTFKTFCEETELEEGYAIDTTRWQMSRRGQRPKGKGNWAFDYTASIIGGGAASLDQDTFFAKSQSTYKDALKQLTKFLKRNLRVKPKDIKIKLAP